jgi:hypothetical protein
MRVGFFFPVFSSGKTGRVHYLRLEETRKIVHEAYKIYHRICSTRQKISSICVKGLRNVKTEFNGGSS